MTRLRLALAFAIVFGLGMLAGATIARAAASRPARLDCTGNVNRLPTASGSLDGRTGAPLEGVRTTANASVAPVGTSAATPSPAVVASPTPRPTTGPTPVRSPRPAASTPAPSRWRLAASGVASFVDPSFGPRYLALPLALGGRGRLVRLCANGRCIVRRSTDEVAV